MAEVYHEDTDMPGSSDRARQTGFTLLELMIALAVAAILALVTLPAYSRYVVEGRLSEGPALLGQLAVTLEQRYLETRRYDQDGACATVQGRHFTVQCQILPGGYRLTAANRAGVGLGAAGRYVYTLDSEGRRRTLRYDGEARDLPCWQLHAQSGCL